MSWHFYDNIFRTRINNWKLNLRTIFVSLVFSHFSLSSDFQVATFLGPSRGEKHSRTNFSRCLSSCSFHVFLYRIFLFFFYLISAILYSSFLRVSRRNFIASNDVSGSRNFHLTFWYYPALWQTFKSNETSDILSPPQPNRFWRV